MPVAAGSDVCQVCGGVGDVGQTEYGEACGAQTCGHGAVVKDVLAGVGERAGVGVVEVAAEAEFLDAAGVVGLVGEVGKDGHGGWRFGWLR